MYEHTDLETIERRQELFRAGVQFAERNTWVPRLEGILMSDVIGSEDAEVAEILESVDCDPAYEEYDGIQVLEFLNHRRRLRQQNRVLH